MQKNLPETRIIVPTVLRDDYLNGVRRVSRRSNTELFVRVMDRAQQFVHALSWHSYEDTVKALTACNAFEPPDEYAKLRLPTP